MPRSRGGRAAPARAPSAPSRPVPQAPPPRAMPPQQQRPMSTTANPAAQTPPQSQSPGLFGQMASTAAGVAVGSSIGHAIGSFFGGGSSAAYPEQQQSYQQPQQESNAYAQPMDGSFYNSQSQSFQQQNAGPCAGDVKNFTNCMDQNQGNLTICGWYLEQLKACQQAARQY